MSMHYVLHAPMAINFIIMYHLTMNITQQVAEKIGDRQGVVSLVVNLYGILDMQMTQRSLQRLQQC